MRVSLLLLFIVIAQLHAENLYSQSTVINFSNALLQSSVNSFGSTAMAGYGILIFVYRQICRYGQNCRYEYPFEKY